MSMDIKSISPEDYSYLMENLKKCSTHTKRLIKPIIQHPAIQRLLLTFLNDKSKSLQEWINEPTAQEVIQRYRDHILQGEVEIAELEKSFNDINLKTSEERLKSLKQALVRVTLHKNDGGEKFKKRLYHAASRCYERAIDEIKMFLDPKLIKELSIQETTEADIETAKCLYVTCCCNIMVCAFKRKDVSTMKIFSNKALKIDPENIKALFYKAKAFFMEYRYDEAELVIATASRIDPTNKDLIDLKEAVTVAKSSPREKMELKKTNVPEVLQKMEENDPQPKILLKEESETTLEAKNQNGIDNHIDFKATGECKPTLLPRTIPLPSTEETPSSNATAKLNQFITRSKLGMYPLIVDISESLEKRQFECHYIYDKLVYCSGVGTSKKIAKLEASRLTIQKLWEEARENDTLIPEDVEGVPIEQPIEVNEEEDTYDSILPLNLMAYEKADNPISVLVTLESKKLIKVRFEIEDKKISKNDHEFHCAAFINNRKTGFGIAASKKKAKNAAAKSALDRLLTDKKLE